MTDAHDHEIGDGLLAGRSQAWAAIYDRYFDRVWHLVGRLVGPDAAAVGDIVQETFLSAARSAGAGKYDPARGTVWVWLAGIARNHVADHFRRRQRDQRIAPGGDLFAPFAEAAAAKRSSQDASPPIVAQVSAEMATAVRMALARLDDDYQAVLVAHYMDGESVGTIARETNSTETAVRSRLARARQAFRETFNRRQPSADPSQGSLP
jgi:RNA polymerase sigma-70 factor (ECF subfamily)